MSNKPIPAPPVISQVAIETDLHAAAQLDTVRRVQDSALEVGRLTGRIESVLFLRTVGDRVIAETFVQLREGKKYKDLSVDDGNGNLRPCGDLREACSHLFGKSYNLCAELAQNLDLLGSDLYDKAQKIGLHRNDYRALRALPADEQQLVQHTIDSASDRDSVADLIGELSERHAKKLAEKDAELDAARRGRQQRDQVINQLQAQADQLHRELAVRSGQRIAAIGDEEDAGELPQLPEEAQIEALGAYARGVEAAIHTTLRKHLVELVELSGDEPPPSHVRLAQQQAITRIIQAARVLAADFGIDLPLSTQTPQELAWLANMDELEAMSDADVPRAVNEDEVAQGWTLLGDDGEALAGGDDVE